MAKFRETGAARLPLALICAALLAPAPPAAAAPYAACAACHGPAGEGSRELGSPALAGLDAAYLERQLRHFRAGVRGADPRDVHGLRMRPLAAALSDEAIVALAAHLAAMPAPAALGGAPGAAPRNGANQYNAACGACHGARAEGNPALHAPRLAGQHVEYLERQYRNYGAGIRGGHPEDRYGRQMRRMATVLPTEQDLSDVLAFIASQRASQ